MKHPLILLIASAALLLASCQGFKAAHADPESAIAGAEAALRQGDYESALQRCDLLPDSLDIAPSLRCRQALVYDRLAEAMKAPEIQLLALRSVSRAYDMSPDSVEAFISNLDLDSRSHLTMLLELHRTIVDPMANATSLEEMMDSIPHDFSDIVIDDSYLEP